jgi:hypothetical protein
MSRPEVRRRNVDPVVAHNRAVKAAAARDSAPYVVRRLIAAHPLDTVIAELVAAAPPLTPAQKATLAQLLAPVGGASA